ncbi:DUF4238 domain-containing protein [Sphingomonas sp. dw_22]|uniref:DUF4238 domain-containing protein n=1 Tax=Sphingomonas sp. dw_22 TaxID=2721175 RepID=UPI001BD387EE|nr:DUF4238 domain-containing protein [Sphingomonas sp. dw_22]
MPNLPKRHHFIPQMILRHFADSDGQLWFWRRGFAEGDVRKAGTQQLFVEKDLYTRFHTDGSKDIALERFFSAMEGNGASFIDQLADAVRSNKLPKLDAGAWEFWDLFFYFQLKRTPGAIKEIGAKMGFDDRIKAAADEIRAIRKETGKDVDEPGLEEWIAKNAVVLAQAAKPSDELLAQFKTMGLAIYRINDPQKSFVVGDVPGATARFRIEGGWSRPTMFLPLTWDIAVGQLGGRRAVEVVMVDREQARRMNIASTTRSTVIAGRSGALIASLSRDVPYTGVI